MTALYMTRTLGGLRPADAAGEHALSAIPLGTDVRAEVTRPRNIKHHRRFFALVGLLAKHSRYDGDQILHLLKLATGHFDELVLKSGEVIRVPRSISFARMDETAFREFESRCFDYIAIEILPGVSKADLRFEVEQLIGAAHQAPRQRVAA